MDNPTPPKNKGGRPVGSSNKMALESRAKAQATGELPHEFLLRIARGEAIYRDVMNPTNGKIERQVEDYDFEDRKDAAKAAAPYYAPKISTVEVIRGVPDDELDAIIKELAAQAGFSTSDGGEGAEGEDQDSAPRSTRRVQLK